MVQFSSRTMQKPDVLLLGSPEVLLDASKLQVSPGLATPVRPNLCLWFLGCSIYGRIQIWNGKLYNINDGNSSFVLDILAALIFQRKSDTLAAPSWK